MVEGGGGRETDRQTEGGKEGGSERERERETVLTRTVHFGNSDPCQSAWRVVWKVHFIHCSSRNSLRRSQIKRETLCEGHRNCNVSGPGREWVKIARGEHKGAREGMG